MILPPINGSEFRGANGEPVVTYTEAQPNDKLLEINLSGEQRASVKFDPNTHRVWRHEGEVIIEPHPKGRAASG